MIPLAARMHNAPPLGDFQYAPDEFIDSCWPQYRARSFRLGLRGRLGSYQFHFCMSKYSLI